jgi:rhodanese-related sulfurtransferase
MCCFKSVNKIVFLLVILVNISCLLNKKSIPLEIACEKIKGGALIIDTRSPREYAKEHLENAINIPHNEIKERLCEISDDKKQPIILYCLTGHRSHYVQKVLREKGYENVFNSGAYRKLKKCD